ncbi:MAG TPA: FG-GAP and VCBS repeat-containing protein, partial [Opitutus sp.]|nr:FG-GAP and VCBS repeat-containing protein [Opitutus sp.]
MKLHLLLWFFAGGVAVAAAPAVPTFRAVEIDANIQIGYGVAVADVNGDAKPDVLLADKHQIVWYENPTWTKHVIAEKLTSNDHVCIAALDIDGDGRCEIAVGAGWNPSDTTNSGAVFYLIAPEDRTQRWEAVALPHEPTVHRMRWMKNTAGTYHLLVVPLHGRGNKPAT